MLRLRLSQPLHNGAKMDCFFQITNKIYSRLKSSSSHQETHQFLDLQINPPATRSTDTYSFNKRQLFSQWEVRTITFSLETLKFQGA